MQDLLTFAGVLLALVPLVMALVNAITEDFAASRWVKRLTALGVAQAIAWAVWYVALLYGLVTVPAGIVALGGVLLGIQAMGIYDFGKMLGGIKAQGDIHINGVSRE